MKRPVCAIVGAGEGLGVALARTFAAAGFDLGLISRKVAGAQPASAAAREAGATSEVFAADARDPLALIRALKHIDSTLGDIEVLIYNPRANPAFKPPLEVTIEELRDALELEVCGAFAAAKAVLPGMLARGRGTILFSSATAALRGSAEGLIYATGKFGLRGMAQSIAKAYANQGIHVVHVRLDCTLDGPFSREMLGSDYDAAKTANGDDVAQSYLWAHRQPRSAWSNEIELRPCTESWTC